MLQQCAKAEQYSDTHSTQLGAPFKEAQSTPPHIDKIAKFVHKQGKKSDMATYGIQYAHLFGMGGMGQLSKAEYLRAPLWKLSLAWAH